MKARRALTSMLLLGLLVGVMASGATAQVDTQEASSPVGQQFTYQGELRDAGGPVTGACDLRFKLWDAATGGGQVGSTATVEGVQLESGRFTAGLDFGTNAFQGDRRWLQILVRCPAGEGSYAALTPRQELMPAPYALYSTRAPWSGLSGVPPDLRDGDADTTYTAGTGLALAGTEFNLQASYRLPQNCGNNQIARWTEAGWACSNTEGGTSFWSLSGNAGTVAGTHFVGTSDNQALELRVNGERGLRLEPEPACPNLVGGFGGNQVTAGSFGATIGGGGETGDPNRVTDNFGTVGGGAHNQAGNLNSTRTDGAYSTIGGGFRNTASALYATVGGGQDNQATSPYATVAGGYSNEATEMRATVGGGQDNSAGFLATVGGGYINTASGEAATVGGGTGNQATGDYATVSGGGPHETDNPASANRATANYATVSGGSTNVASQNWSSIGGGFNNKAQAAYATVAGGATNQADGEAAAVLGGNLNGAFGEYSTIGGGFWNTASGSHATVGGGQQNVAAGAFATVAGGGPYPTNEPGTSNAATDNYATVGGGADNIAGADDGNPASAPYATIGGGYQNRAYGRQSTIGGGGGNQAAYRATVGGGLRNLAIGSYSAIPGGIDNYAGGTYSFAAGRNAHAATTGSFVWADSLGEQFSTGGVSDSFNVRANGGVWLVVDSDPQRFWRCWVNSGSSWTCTSDRNMKENLVRADGQQILDRLDDVPIYYWSGIGHTTLHLGPMAQDFYAAFGLGDDDRAIATIDLDGVALAAIQGLHAENQSLRAQVDNLEQRLAALEALVQEGAGGGP